MATGAFFSLNVLLIAIIIMSPFKTCQSLLSSTRTAATRRRQRYPILSSMSTQYTINDEVCPPVDEGELRKIVERHCRSLDSYLSNRPIAAHTEAAFNQIYDRVDPSRKVILDSGCGTGRSTLLLGEMFPDHTVIGIDRSFVRLNRNALQNERAGDINPRDRDNYDKLYGDGEVDEDRESNGQNNSSSISSSQRPFQAVSSNVLLVRAELTDFWRCTLQTNWDISHHYLLYPNPYPKKNRIKKRFYAHPSFPIILKLGGQITVRSNWEGYLKEFANSVVYAHEFYEKQKQEQEQEGDGYKYENIALPYYNNSLRGPKERINKTVAWTNFEKKYDDVSEKTYELIL